MSILFSRNMIGLRLILFILVMIILSILPKFASGYIVAFFAILFMYAATAQAWNIFTGFSGYWSFGHHMFFGIGAYTVAILVVKFNANIYLATLAAGFSAMLFAIPIGAVMLRLKGAYFTICSLALPEILKVIAINEEWLTGGGNGILLPPLIMYESYYYMMIVMLIITTIIAYIIKNSTLGYALFAIRDDELAAESCGVFSTKYKVMILALTAFITGIIGGCWAWYVVFIDPYCSFDSLIQLIATVSTIFGGLGKIYGPIIGAVVFTTLLEFLWISFPYVYLVVLGISIVLIMRFLPDGILGKIEKSEQLLSIIEKYRLVWLLI